MIYFIQAKKGGPIKIGFTTKAATQRLMQLQTSCPDELVILKEREGSVDQERALHANLSDHRIRGEWYNPTDEVIATMNAPLPDPLPVETEAFSGVAKPNPGILDGPDLSDEQTAYQFTQELVRQIVNHRRGLGMNIGEAIEDFCQKCDLGRTPDSLWKGKKCNIRISDLHRIFKEWLSCIHPDLVDYSQQILTHVCENRVFTSKRVLTDDQCRAAIREIKDRYRYGESAL